MRLSQKAILLIVPLALLAFGLLTWMAYDAARDREVIRSVDLLRTARVEAETEVERRITEIRKTEARARELMRLALEDEIGSPARFDRLFPKKGDGSRRGAEFLWTGKAQQGIPARGIGAFVSGENVPEDRRKTILAAYDTLRSMTEGLGPTIESLYFYTTTNDLVMYAPRREDQLKFYRTSAPANLNFQDREFATITSPKVNPSGRMRCTSLTQILYDQGGYMWTTGCMTAMRTGGRHLGAWGSSIPLDSLLKDLQTDVPGVQNIIIADDGKLIRHPDYTVQSSRETERFLDLDSTKEPRLQALWHFVQKERRNDFEAYSPELDAYVSMARLGQPNWVVISLIPGERVRSAAFGLALPLLLAGTIGALVFIAVALWFINRQIARPVAAMAVRADAIAALANRKEGEVPPEPPVDEIERLGLAFHEMEQRIDWERANLSRSFDTLVDAVSDYGIVLLDKDGRIIRANQGAHRLLGWNPDARPEGLAGVFGPGGKGEWRYMEFLVRAARDGRISEDAVRYRSDGSEFWANDSADALIGIDGEALGFAYIIRDVTGERERMMQIEESVSFLELAESTAQLGHFLVDTQRLTVRLSKWVCDLYGYPHGTEIGFRDVGKLIAPEDRRRVLEVLQRARMQLEPFETTFDLIDKQGRRRTAFVKASPLSAGMGGVPRGLFGIARDITERTVAEARLVAARDAAQAAADMRRDLLATVSHEIRTPMTGILGLLDQMKREQSASKRALALKLIEDSADALMRVLDDVLQDAKIESGSFVVEKIEFDTQDLMLRVTELFRPLARRKGIGLTMSDDCGRRLVGDPARIQQIVANFLSNSIKFTSNGGVSLHCSCRPLNVPDMLELIVEVEDTGIGIPQDRLSQIFQSFEQAEASTERRFGGTGLGLAISRRLAQAMGGTVEVESTEGKGSRFTLRLPQGMAQGADLRRPGKGKDALVVSSSASARVMAEALVAELGYSTKGSGNLCNSAGDEALVVFDADETDPQDWEGIAPGQLLALVSQEKTALRQRLAEAGIRMIFKPIELDALRQAVQQ
ncbi:hypothetical protein SZ64_10075 [Erythrobacter sp. SG61-1L]|uniref:HAMP domain-containing histidine kinase n=1 Tax=Erythrobacter sp. SG61-1L TaxID=1603897 RepID=UPI0006C8F60A|nr:HAMP domain-containing histidine kinase [Erythrobacter sp. SG61-1L]KPL68431.1 hypothetical protein SZ64_10075 [Erythrobacter sp. SG61-1L]